MSAIVIHLAAMLLVVAPAMVAPFSSEAAYEAAMWSLMPIVGALGASLMAFLLNRVSENRPAVAGRVIGSMAAGVGAPRLIGYMEPFIPKATVEMVKAISIDPVMMILIGFGFGLLGYAAAKYVVEKAFKIAPTVVDKGMEQLAEAVSQKVVVKTAENVQAAVEAAVVSKQTEKLTSDTPTTRFNR